MKVKSSQSGVQILSSYAEFVLQEKFSDFIGQLVFYSGKAYSLLVQKILQQPDHMQRVHDSAQELLHWLRHDDPRTYAVRAIEKWKNDQLYGISKFEIGLSDIVEINGIRQSSLLAFVPNFCRSVEEVHLLNQEVRVFFEYFNRLALDTYSKISRERLQISEEQLLEAQAIAEVGSFIWSFNGSVKEYSPQLKRILETDTLPTATEFLKNVHADDRQRLQEAYQNALTTGVLECEYRYIAGGREKNLCTRARVEFSQDVPFVLKGIVQDISTWKKIEAELIKKSVELKETNTRLEHFAAMASHDLKEPLRKMRTYSSFINLKEKENLSVVGQDYLKKIGNAADRMSLLIDNLLDYASLNKNGQKIHCSLQKILEEVIESLELTIREKEAKILSDGLPDAYVIPFQMQQLFQNLISNALKFCKTNEKPVVLISHAVFDPGADSREKKVLTIEIADNCIGISNQHKDKIFDVFYRAHDKATFDGSGLGLAICHRIVENHQGSITVISEENKGTTFKIVLPQ
jgi:signal transduction histidine kinase